MGLVFLPEVLQVMPEVLQVKCVRRGGLRATRRSLERLTVASAIDLDQCRCKMLACCELPITGEPNSPYWVMAALVPSAGINTLSRP